MVVGGIIIIFNVINMLVIIRLIIKKGMKIVKFI